MKLWKNQFISSRDPLQRQMDSWRTGHQTHTGHQNRVLLKSQRNSTDANHHQSTSTGAVSLQLEM